PGGAGRDLRGRVAAVRPGPAQPPGRAGHRLCEGEGAMSVTGEAIIGGIHERGAAGSFKAWDPARRDYLEPAFHVVDASQVDRACRLAGEAFGTFRATSDEQRARFLDTVAEQIMLLGEELIERAMAESGLPRVRLEGERGRTC